MSRLYLSPPHMSGRELELVNEAFASNWIAPLGPHVTAFEAEMCARLGTGHACALSSGTAALHLGLIILGVSAGDEVWCSTLTFSATANAIRYLGAVPVFVDSDQRTWNIDPALLERPWMTRPVGAGYPRRSWRWISTVRRRLRRYPRRLPSPRGPGHRGCRRGPGCHLPGAGGGCLRRHGGALVQRQQDHHQRRRRHALSSDAAVTERALFLATQARDPAPHYQHSEVGYNYRLSNVLAAIGRGQLSVLDDRVEARRRNFSSTSDGWPSCPG